MEETSHLYADPSTSPFVRYGGGYAVFPPNEVRNGLAAILEALASGTSREEVWRRFVEYAWIGGTSEIHPASTWHAVGLDFAEYYHQHFGGSPAVYRTALEAARLMLSDEIDVSWKRLEAFLLDHIDEISGWSESWIRSDAEERHVIRRDDGTYWYPDASGTLIQIIGARTLPETRLDFITDSILRPWGSVRQVLTLFALVAVSEDFRRDRSAYPIALRVAIFRR